MKDLKTPEECKALYDQCVENVLNAADNYIVKRFSDFDNRPLNDLISLFDYRSYPSSFTSNNKWGPHELEDVLKYYTENNYITYEDMDLMKKEFSKGSHSKTERKIWSIWCKVHLS